MLAEERVVPAVLATDERQRPARPHGAVDPAHDPRHLGAQDGQLLYAVPAHDGQARLDEQRLVQADQQAGSEDDRRGGHGECRQRGSPRERGEQRGAERHGGQEQTADPDVPLEGDGELHEREEHRRRPDSPRRAPGPEGEHEQQRDERQPSHDPVGAGVLGHRAVDREAELVRDLSSPTVAWATCSARLVTHGVPTPGESARAQATRTAFSPTPDLRSVRPGNWPSGAPVSRALSAYPHEPRTTMASAAAPIPATTNRRGVRERHASAARMSASDGPSASAVPFVPTARPAASVAMARSPAWQSRNARAPKTAVASTNSAATRSFSSRPPAGSASAARRTAQRRTAPPPWRSRAGATRGTRNTRGRRARGAGRARRNGRMRRLPSSIPAGSPRSGATRADGRTRRGRALRFPPAASTQPGTGGCHRIPGGGSDEQRHQELEADRAHRHRGHRGYRRMCDRGRAHGSAPRPPSSRWWMPAGDTPSGDRRGGERHAGDEQGSAAELAGERQDDRGQDDVRGGDDDHGGDERGPAAYAKRAGHRDGGDHEEQHADDGDSGIDAVRAHRSRSTSATNGRARPPGVTRRDDLRRVHGGAGRRLTANTPAAVEIARSLSPRRRWTRIGSFRHEQPGAHLLLVVRVELPQALELGAEVVRRRSTPWWSISTRLPAGSRT